MCAFGLTVANVSRAGVPEPYDVRNKEKEEAVLLSISNSAFEELVAAHPEQLEIITSSLLDQYGLTRAGDDKQAGSASKKQQESETELTRIELKVSLALLCCTLLCCVFLQRTV